MDIKNRILEATDIREIIAESVSLRAVNHHYLGLCPFHEEKTPSFYVYPDHYHCYGCQAHGDVIAFVMKQYRLEFLEALRWLARKANLDDSELNPRKHAGLIKQQQHQKAIFGDAQQFFTANLWKSTSSTARQAKEYILSRGFEAQFLQDHGFGYCPHGGTELLRYLSHRGYSHKELFAASLISQESSQSHSRAAVYDFFKARLTLPIFDHQAQLIAFAGRWVGTANYQAKYKNSRYAKNQILYGFHWAKSAIQTTKRVLITEGYMDTLRLRSAGWLETVSCQGTALSPFHLKSLARHARKIILVFDGDAAGETAATRLLPLTFNYPQLNFELVRLPSGHDPDSFLQEHTPHEFEALLAAAPPLLSAILVAKINNSTPEHLLALIQTELLPWIKSLHSPLQQELLMRQLAEHSGLSYGSLLKQLNHTKTQLARPSGATAQHTTSTTAATSLNLAALSPIWAEFMLQILLATPQDNLDLEAIKTFLTPDIPLEADWIALISHSIDALENHHHPLTYLHSQRLTDPQFIEHIRSQSRRYATEHRNCALRQIMLTYQMAQIKTQITDLQIYLKREKDLISPESQLSEHWLKMAQAIKDLRAQYLHHHKESLALKKKITHTTITLGCPSFINPKFSTSDFVTTET